MKFKYEGLWYSKEKYIELMEAKRGKKTTDKPIEAKEVVEPIETTPKEIKEPVEKELTLEELQTKYKEVSGKGISPRVAKDREWLVENINKYNK
jgi:hypothetical protein